MFKKLFFAIFSILFFATITFSLPTQRANCLEWDLNPANSTMGVTNYNVYWRDGAGVYNNTNKYVTPDALGLTACFVDIIALPDPENKYYVITVQNAGGESVFSNEVQLVPLDQIVPDAPGVLRLIVN